MSPIERDPVLIALDELEVALDGSQELMTRTKRRAQALREMREEGRSYAEAVEVEAGPLIVGLMRQTVASLTAAASRFQRAEAQALWDEGMTMDRIAAAFGITRQRVSELLGSPGRRPKQS